MSQAEKDAMLVKHNDYRRNVGEHAAQPCTASDIRELQWDATLEAEADAWALQCIGDHDPLLQGKGENLHMDFDAYGPSRAPTIDELNAGPLGWYINFVGSLGCSAFLPLRS